MSLGRRRIEYSPAKDIYETRWEELKRKGCLVERKGKLRGTEAEWWAL